MNGNVKNANKVDATVAEFGRRDRTFNADAKAHHRFESCRLYLEQRPDSMGTGPCRICGVPVSELITFFMLHRRVVGDSAQSG